MSASDIKFTEPDEVIRKPVVPKTGDGASQGDSGGDRSPTDEENKRDAPVKPLPDNGEDLEKVRQPIIPDAS